MPPRQPYTGGTMTVRLRVINNNDRGREVWRAARWAAVRKLGEGVVGGYDQDALCPVQNFP